VATIRLSLGEQLQAVRLATELAAVEEEAALARAYERELRRISRLVAKRFVQLVGILQASADWTPPTAADVLAVQVETARIRQAQASMMGAITGTIQEAGLATPGGVAVGFGLIAPMPQQILNQMGVRAAALSEAIREPVVTAITRGWAEGAPVPQTAKYIQAAALGVTRSQATMLARTDLTGMNNGANQWAVQELNAAAQQNQESKPFETKTWLSAGDARVRDTHQQADGQNVPVGQPYNVGGSMMSYPGDPFGPNSEVCNCRCTETYEERVRAPEATRAEPEPTEPMIVAPRGARAPSQLMQMPKETMRRDFMTDDQVDFFETMDKVAADLDEALPGGISDAAAERLTPVGGQLPIKANAELGAYGRYSNMGKSPIQIEVRPGSRASYEHSIYNTTMHEVGHWLDHAVLSLETRSATFMSQVAKSGAERGWMSRFVERVAATDQSKGLQKVLARKTQITLDDGRVIKGANLKRLQEKAEYLERPHEQWARAFAHWMTKRHGSMEERELLHVFIQDELAGKARRGGLDFRSDWTDEEFAPIAEAIEGVLREAGLLGDDLVASGDLNDVFPGRLAALQGRDPVDRGETVDPAEIHHPLDDLLLRPAVGSGLRGIDHESHPTARAARAPAGVGVAFQDASEEDSMSAVEVDTTEAQEPATGRPWVSDIAYEGMSTGDGRYMAPDALRWRTPPLTLMSMMETTEGGHLGAQVAGRMDTFDKSDGPRISGEQLPDGVTLVRSTGFFDIGDWGADTERLVDSQTVTGISVDLAIHDWALRDPDSGDIVAPDDATQEQWEAAMAGLMEFAILDAEIMAATVCPTPAFADAKIALLASADRTPWMPHAWFASAEGAEKLGVPEGYLMTTLQASAHEVAPLAPLVLLAAADRPEPPLNPPRSIFFRPEADVLTPLTVDGYEVYGHLAPWDACHVGLINGAWSQCVTPPHSISGYQEFHSSGHVETAEGDVIPIGKLMVSDAGHAPASGTPAAAKRFYDKNGAAGAYVRAVDGRLGIWFSGQLRPGITEEQIAALRANAQSGDWRGNSPHDLELIAAVTVAIPGYGVPSQVALAASADGEMYVSTMILTCQIGEPVGRSAAGRAAAALMDGGTAALHALIAE
jgi:hypothetical protein